MSALGRGVVARETDRDRRRDRPRGGDAVGIRKGEPAGREIHDDAVRGDLRERIVEEEEAVGCGACVAACPNSAGQLFTSAKVAHLNLLPQGQAERYSRVEAMVDTMEDFFGSCTNHGECQEACPKEISIDFIALMNKDYLKAKFKNRRLLSR